MAPPGLTLANDHLALFQWQAVVAAFGVGGGQQQVHQRLWQALGKGFAQFGAAVVKPALGDASVCGAAIALAT